MFLFFNYEKQLRQLRDRQDVLEEVSKLFEEIIVRLKKEEENGIITAYEASILFDGLKIVLDALGKTNRVQEEVEEIMGGRVLEFSADKIYDAGKEEGREEGRMEGWEEGRMEGREEGRMEGREEGLTQGEDRGKIRTLWGLVEDKILSKETAAARAGLSIDDFSEKAKKILAEPAEKYEES